MNELQLTEEADVVVTVLDCKGNNLDIRAVNPIGTNYIADFSYYMAKEDEEYPKWMSKALSIKIREWQQAVDEATPGWEKLVLELRDLYQIQTELNRVYFEKKLQDLETARDRYLLANTDRLNNLEDLEKSKAIFTAEVVKVDEYSLDELSQFKSIPFDRNIQYTCYRTPPRFEQMNRLTDTGAVFWSGRFTFEFNDDGNTGSFNDNGLHFNDPDAPTIAPVGGFEYFADPAGNNNISYCKLIHEVAEIETDIPDNPTVRWRVSGFERYTIFSDVRKWIEFTKIS